MAPQHKSPMVAKIALFSLSVLVIALGVTIFILIRPDHTKIVTDRDCSAPSIDWMTVSNTVDHQTLAGLASQFAAAATTDAEGLKNLANTKLKGDFTTALKDVGVQALHSQQSVSVTQEFF